MTMTDTASTYYLGQPHLGRLLNCLESLWKETPIVHLKLSNTNRVYCTTDRTKRICFTNHSLTEGIISTTAKIQGIHTKSLYLALASLRRTLTWSRRRGRLFLMPPDDEVPGRMVMERA